MIYTASEIETIKSNLKAVEQYAKENWVPRLRHSESAYFKCGKLRFYRDTFTSEEEHTFGVHGSGEITWRTGGLILSFNPPEWRKDRSLYDAWTYGVDIFGLWEQIKRGMESELARKESERNAVMAFHV